jgi:hypothetical protein
VTNIKKILCILFLIFAFQNIARAFPVHANVRWNRGLATANIQNHFGRPIICSGNAQGLTYSGVYLYSYLNNQIIYPGNFYELYVYTNNYNPFINASAFINCNWY